MAATEKTVMQGRIDRRRLGLLTLVLTVFLWQPVQAGDYPERTIKIVVPFPAGGPTDVAARLIAQSLATKFGKGVVVENHPGAGGRIGAKVVAAATPDGYTLLLGGTNVNAIGAIYTDLGFDPINSFAPIAIVCVDSLAIAVSPRVPADNFNEFVSYAKHHPGQLKYGASPGIYTQFAGEMAGIAANTDDARSGHPQFSAGGPVRPAGTCGNAADNRHAAQQRDQRGASVGGRPRQPRRHRRRCAGRNA